MGGVHVNTWPRGTKEWIRMGGKYHNHKHSNLILISTEKPDVTGSIESKIGLKTTEKLGINYADWLGDRLSVSHVKQAMSCSSLWSSISSYNPSTNIGPLKKEIHNHVPNYTVPAHLSCYIHGELSCLFMLNFFGGAIFDVRNLPEHWLFQDVCEIATFPFE